MPSSLSVPVDGPKIWQIAKFRLPLATISTHIYTANVQSGIYGKFSLSPSATWGELGGGVGGELGGVGGSWGEKRLVGDRKRASTRTERKEDVVARA